MLFIVYQLKPFEHYIPVKHDLSDLLDQIEWAKTHDEEAIYYLKICGVRYMYGTIVVQSCSLISG